MYLTVTSGKAAPLVSHEILHSLRLDGCGLVPLSYRMARSSTIRIDFEKLARRGPSAAVVVRLMMACNDMSLADQSLARWMKNPPRHQMTRRAGAELYFIRLMLAHLNEAMTIIGDVYKDSVLLALVEQCDAQTQAAFRELAEYLPHGLRHQNFQKLIGQLRNNVTFHYDHSGKQLMRALGSLSSRDEDRSSTITRANHAHHWHFCVADKVVENVVHHQIWKIPELSATQSESSIRSNARQYIGTCHEIFLLFVDFAGEFIWKYCSE